LLKREEPTPCFKIGKWRLDAQGDDASGMSSSQDFELLAFHDDHVLGGWKSIQRSATACWPPQLPFLPPLQDR
jgi:hypothetical protein